LLSTVPPVQSSRGNNFPRGSKRVPSGQKPKKGFPLKNFCFFLAFDFAGSGFRLRFPPCGAGQKGWGLSPPPLPNKFLQGLERAFEDIRGDVPPFFHLTPNKGGRKFRGQFSSRAAGIIKQGATPKTRQSITRSLLSIQPSSWNEGKGHQFP